MGGNIFLKNLSNKYECPKCKSNDLTRSSRTFNEKLLTLFTSILPYRCRNCGNRFYSYSRRFIVKVSVILGLIILFNLGTYFYTVYRGEHSVPAIKAQIYQQIIPEFKSKRAQTQEKTSHEGEVQSDKTAMTQDQSEKIEARTSTPKPIKFADYKKFGAKWNAVENGLRISHVKEGPLKDAGMMEGDIFVSLNGKSARDEDMLKIRDEIVSGQQKKAVVGVLRGNKMLYFELQK